MKLIKCKNETEKLHAIMDFCNAKIEENNSRIKWFENEQSSPFDYADEIDELKTRNTYLNMITDIIEADEFTSVLIF